MEYEHDNEPYNASNRCYDNAPEVNLNACIEQDVKAHQGKDSDYAVNNQDYYSAHKQEEKDNQYGYDD